MSAAALPSAWTSLACGQAELRLDVTLPTGQSFRWRHADGLYTGVVGRSVVQLRQSPGEEGDVQCRQLLGEPNALDDVRSYLNLDVKLAQLHKQFADADAARFAPLLPFVRGARVLRQPPAECLFSFICSSNNNVKRIAGMVERLCEAYGERLHPAASPSASPDQPAYYAFPTLAALATADEARLRALGFGYRAPFIVNAAKQLQAQPGGGDAYLSSLRSDTVSASEAVKALSLLPGVGPKVAACAALFSLDKHSLVPVDTHVYQLSVAHYGLPESETSLTPKVMAACQAQLHATFGAYAGWAHTALFVAELPQLRALLPEELRTPAGLAPGAAKRKKAKADAKEAAGGEVGGKKARVAKAKRALVVETPAAA